MRIRIIFVSVILSAALFGCAGVQNQIFTWDDQNAAISMSSAKQIMKHLGGNLAALKEALSDQKPQMPVNFWATVGKLDDMVKKYPDQASIDKMGEVDGFTIVVLYAKLYEPIITSLINQYAPKIMGEILKYAPMGMSL
jgi:hypothetical protein